MGDRIAWHGSTCLLEILPDLIFRGGLEAKVFDSHRFEDGTPQERTDDRRESALYVYGERVYHSSFVFDEAMAGSYVCSH